MRRNNKIILLVATILAAVVSSGYFLQANTERPSLMFLCGSGMRAPVLEITRDFEAKTGVRVHAFFDGSSILSDFISTFRTGDLFLPGDEENLGILQKQGMVADSSFLAWHVAALFVSPALKDKIKDVDDLAAEGPRIAMPNPRQSSLGRLVMKNLIEQHPAGEAMLRNIAIYGSSAQDVLELYRRGQINAMFEWDVVAADPESAGLDLVMVPIKAPYQFKDPLRLGLLSTSGKPELARQFYDYMLTRGREVFRRYGYNVEEGP